MQKFKRDRDISFSANKRFCDSLKGEDLINIIRAYLDPSRRHDEIINAALKSAESRIKSKKIKEG